MKLIQAIIRKEKLNEVLTALFAKEVYGVTVSKVQGHGGETEEVQNYRGTKKFIEFARVKKMRQPLHPSWLADKFRFAAWPSLLWWRGFCFACH